MDWELHQLELRYAALRRTSPRKERAVLASVSAVGQQSPVVVVPLEDGRAVLVDGYKRVRALKRLGQDTVRATEWALPEVEALLLERLLRNGEADGPLEQGWLVRELCERFGLSCAEVARRFDKSESWVSRRLGLVRQLPESIQQQVRQGQLAAHAAMKHLLPLARAKKAEAEQLAGVLSGRQLSTRDIGALCVAWREGSAATRALILENPALALRAAAELARPPPVARPAQRVLEDFAALGDVARRLEQALREGQRAGWVRPLHRELKHAAQGARAQLESLFTLCHQETDDAGFQ
ncbi:ParB N-terminal domain-containing protein [Myxococcus sp. RHSTA-1-4]|uniref:ParB/RepB/Spo0J family partition protein n=1 Tax=Myxococcus sp. RHSTA-1-4 TaxID=2874601 RepID=UPI001CC10BAB|nr:ParB N-terminal domain-containing protein [Myxococcus sp. RHSTA-1-4]MBZ4423269.1 ParB N-terminal domain-containing protein [Myxococcus sp. RHSTA-1-4]